jgi:hypothetical protein
VLGVEEVVGVVAELEERERVGAVGAHERGRPPAKLGARQPTFRRRPAKHRIRHDEQDQQPDRLHDRRDRAGLVVVPDRPRLPEQEPARVLRDEAWARVGRRRRPEDEERDAEPGGEHGRQAPHHRSQAGGVGGNGECAPAADEHRGGAEAQGGVSELVPDDLHHAEGRERRHGQRPGSTAAAVEVQRRQCERRGRGDGERMEHRDRAQRPKLEQQVVAQAAVEDGRGGVRDRGEQRQHGGQRRQRVEPAQRPQRRHGPVQTELPGGGVALRPEEVTPVLRDQPDPGGRERQHRRVVDVHEPEPDRRDVRDRQQDAEVPLVHPDPEDVDARTESMTLDAERLPARDHALVNGVGCGRTA